MQPWFRFCLAEDLVRSLEVSKMVQFCLDADSNWLHDFSVSSQVWGLNDKATGLSLETPVHKITRMPFNQSALCSHSFVKLSSSQTPGLCWKDFNQHSHHLKHNYVSVKLNQKRQSGVSEPWLRVISLITWVWWKAMRYTPISKAIV